MHIRFDPEADAAYFSLVGRDLRAGEAVTQSDIIPTPSGEGSVIIDFDADGRLLGIEVLWASLVLPAGLLENARPWGPGDPPETPSPQAG